MKKRTQQAQQSESFRSVHWTISDEVEITIRTRVPEKWLFIDRETGNIWKWSPIKREGSTAPNLIRA